MARTKKAGKLTVKAVAPPLIVSELAESDLGDASALIRSLTAEREGVEWNVKVYLVPGAMGRGSTDRQQYLFKCELEDLPELESRLGESYPGGGIFRVQIRADNALVKNITLDIAPRPGWKPPPPSYLTPVAPPAAEAQSTDRMEMFFGRMAEMMERSAQQTRDMIAAISARPTAPAAPTMAEQLQMFAQFQSMLPKGAQENSMDLFQKGMDFAMKMLEARGGGDSTNWLDVVKEAINSPVVKDMMTGMAAAVAQQHQPALAAPPALVSQQNPVAAQAVDTLIRQAQAGVDPKMVAQQVMNSMPPQLMDELERQDDVVQYLISQFPAVAQHRAWFAALVAEIWEEDTSGGKPSPTLSDPDAGKNNSVQPPA